MTTYTSGANCLDCSSYCDTCVDSNTCAVCSSGYYFYKQKCYVQCPSKAPYLSPTVSPYTCYETCPTATPYSYKNLCYTSCPAEAPYLYDNICYSTSLVAEATKISNLAGSIASTTLIARGVASFSDPGLYMFGSLMKLLEYTRYMNISHSDGLEILFQTISDSSNLIPMPSMSDEMQDAFENHSLPDVFARYDLPSNFMLNEGDDILAELTILGLFVLAWLLHKGVYYLRNVETMRSLVTKSRLFFQNYLLGQFYEMLGDVFFATVFEFRTLSLGDRYSWLSVTACVSCLTLGTTLYLTNFWIVYAYQKKKRKRNTEALRKFSEQHKGIGVIFDSFGDESFIHQAVLIFFVTRNIILSQVIALAYSMPLFQSAILLILSFFMMIYYVTLRPMKSRLEFAEQLSYEILLLIVNACFFILALCDSMQASTRTVVNSIGQAIIVFNIAFKFLPFIFLAIHFGLIIWKYYKLLKSDLKSQDTGKKKRISEQLRNDSSVALRFGQDWNNTSLQTFDDQTNLTIDQNMTVSQISILQLDSLRKSRRAQKLSRTPKKSKSKSTQIFHANRHASPTGIRMKEFAQKHLSAKRAAGANGIRKKERISEMQRAGQINKRVEKDFVL